MATPDLPEQSSAAGMHAVQILLVEDSPADVELTRQALAEANVVNEVHVVSGRENASAAETEGLNVHLVQRLDPLLRVPGVRRFRMAPTCLTR